MANEERKMVPVDEQEQPTPPEVLRTMGELIKGQPTVYVPGQAGSPIAQTEAAMEAAATLYQATHGRPLNPANAQQSSTKPLEAGK